MISYMYVRFNAEITTPEGERLFGIFKVSQYLSDAHLITDPDDDDRLWQLFEWFNKYLSLPTKSHRSKNHDQDSKALAWFKDTSTVHISVMHEISDITQRYGGVVDFVTTEKPGYILYEDDYQVFAEPFKD